MNTQRFACEESPGDYDQEKCLEDCKYDFYAYPKGDLCNCDEAAHVKPRFIHHPDRNITNHRPLCDPWQLYECEERRRNATNQDKVSLSCSRHST